MFNYIYETKYSDFKDYDHLKTITLLDAVQEAAIRDSANVGFGISELRKINRAWLLKGFCAHIEKPAVTAYPTIEAFTGVKRFGGATSERGTIVRQNGEVVLKCIADWFLFDTEGLRPARITDEMLESYECFDFNDDFFTFKKPKLISDSEPLYKVRVGKKDIDTNVHMNNLKSAELLMDALPNDFVLRDISVLYKHQAYLGDVLTLSKKELDEGIYVQLTNSKGDICVAGFFSI